MSDLVAPHGGLSEPLDLTVPAAERAAFEAEAAKLPKVPVSDADLSTVYRFGDGALSPLSGPMGSGRGIHHASGQVARGAQSACGDASRAGTSSPAFAFDFPALGSAESFPPRQRGKPPFLE